jgi:hypothetical protein
VGTHKNTPYCYQRGDIPPWCEMRTLLKQKNSDEMATLKAPSKKDIVGILLSAETIESKSGDVVLISVQDIDDEITTLTASPNYWKKVGKLFPADTIVKLSYEQRLKDITGYVPEGATEMVAHTSDGNNLSGINRFSTTAFQRMLDSKDMEQGVAVISSVEPDRVNAVASYLSAFVRK